ncbi:Long-chain-fatty-acid--CoA ligase FadD15, partial [Clarias magur]
VVLGCRLGHLHTAVNGSVYKGYVPSGERCQCPSGLITLQGGHCADHRGTHSPP